MFAFWQFTEETQRKTKNYSQKYFYGNKKLSQIYHKSKIIKTQNAEIMLKSAENIIIMNTRSAEINTRSAEINTRSAEINTIYAEIIIINTGIIIIQHIRNII